MSGPSSFFKVIPGSLFWTDCIQNCSPTETEIYATYRVGRQSVRLPLSIQKQVPMSLVQSPFWRQAVRQVLRVGPPEKMPSRACGVCPAQCGRNSQSARAMLVADRAVGVDACAGPISCAVRYTSERPHAVKRQGKCRLERGPQSFASVGEPLAERLLQRNAVLRLGKNL